MITVKLYDDIKNIEYKPMSFNEFRDKIKNLFNIDNPENFFYEYLSKDGKYYSLNIYNYPNFFMNNNIEKIFIYANEDEAHYYGNEEEKGESQNPNFYEYNINEEEKINLMDNNKDLDNMVKQRLISEQIKKIRESRLIQNEKRIEIKNDNIDDNEFKENNPISDELNDIINKNFNKIKEELINESNSQLSQIVMESKINNIQNGGEEDNIEVPDSVEEHAGISCSGCGICPIYGIRYRCVYCSGFDYCEKCEKEKGYIHGHPLYKLLFRIN